MPGWLNERLDGAHHLAGEGRTGRRGAGVDAGHERPGARRGGADHAARSGRRRTSSPRTSNRIKATVKGKMVLVGPPQRGARSTFNAAGAAARRRDDHATQLKPRRPQGAAAQRRRPRQQPQQTRAAAAAHARTRSQEQLNQFLLDSGALVRINDAGRDHGQIRAFNNRDTTTSRKAPPTVVMRNEDYGRICAAARRWPRGRARIRHRQSHATRKGAPATT